MRWLPCLMLVTCAPDASSFEWASTCQRAQVTGIDSWDSINCIPSTSILTAQCEASAPPPVECYACSHTLVGFCPI